MSKVIRIGTRDSELALWQATTVQQQLESLGYQTILVSVKSTGDLILDKPLYELGITGIFTKTLDVAMLNGTVDIAVHSMKDVPTALPNGIVQSAVLKRAATQDVLVTTKSIDYSKHCTIATGSLRRKAQWLHKYPHHSVVDLRGNVQTRLKKLQENDWDGAIFAKAGLDRLGYVKNEYIITETFKGFYTKLHWMLPAPAQGAMVIVTLQQDDYSTDAIKKINHAATEIATTLERQFLRTLEGGCTAPIGALASIDGDKVNFKGCLFSLDGKEKLEIEQHIAIKDYNGFGQKMATELLNNGGALLMEKIKNEMNN